MDRKIGFGFKLNKKTVESKSLFAEDDEPKERKKLVPFDEDDEQPKQIPFEEDEPKEKLIVFDKEHPKKLVDFEEDEVSDELREKMGFSGFGKIKPRKEPKVSQKTADEPESKSKPKARQFDLEKQIGISKEIAEERRSKLEQLEQLDDLPAEDAPKAVSTESDVQKEESDQDDTPADPADQGAENEEDDLDEGEDNR